MGVLRNSEGEKQTQNAEENALSEMFERALNMVIGYLNDLHT